MTEKRPITFNFDNDNRPIKEAEIEGKLFEPQYRQALLQVESYLRELELEKTEENQKESKDKNYTEHIHDDIDYNNNIFAFEGGRGTGKTSCMISVADMLIKKKCVKERTHPFIYKDKFVTIDLIDPAYFDKAHNLLSLFLAKLYKSFIQQIEDSENGRISTNDKQKFLSCYREAHSQLHRLYQERKNDNFSDEDLMEYVEEASASVNLKRTIKELVDAYIDCFHWKDTVLILRIDDVDMDFAQASEMIESMRKYFVQPNLLVFVSCSLEQLKLIKVREFMSGLKDGSKKSCCEELAEKYLTKVFPQSHCIQMPEPATYHDYELYIIGKFVTEAGLDCPIDSDEENMNKEVSRRKFVSVKQALLELILKKTRYLFYNTNYYESYIVPRNLRELRQLMKLLITMPDYHADNQEHPHNKTLFKEYFYGTWVHSNLISDDREHVLKLRSILDMTLFNKTLLEMMKTRFRDYLSASPEVNRYLPVSTSDILTMISEIEPRLIQEKDRKFLFFIKSYYSMLLYDTYCEILGELEEKKRPLKRKLEGSDGKTRSSILRQDKWSMYYDYEKLIGGSFVQLKRTNTDIILNAEKLRALVNECKDICTKQTLTDEEKSKVLMAEVLVLSIYYVRVNDKDESVRLYEQWETIPTETTKSQVVISSGAFLFNITRYDQSISRYDKDFYKVMAESASYDSFKKRIINGEDEKNDYGYIHRVSLRNFEVLQDIIVRCEGTESFAGFELFFSELDKLANYAFPLYEYKAEDKENYNKIHLTFLKVIMDAIQSMRNNPDFLNNLLVNASSLDNYREDVTGNNTSNISGTDTETTNSSVDKTGEA
ncbi:hypothetical protein L6466_13490 [Prevotella communis]|uniref:hypothetical protein n=1 Tax=Prevotella communis TaxID=2913614 RepID=UPI001EDB6251|nr:hypothetical protein [Prevotella communis]UKK67547.1 hypothetical protein L6464_13175 [Prevotella communis]UKK70306.1 hypothetical protein L6466_13490 [Prevotella communis]